MMFFVFSGVAGVRPVLCGWWGWRLGHQLGFVGGMVAAVLRWGNGRDLGWSREFRNELELDPVAAILRPGLQVGCERGVGVARLDRLKAELRALGAGFVRRVGVSGHSGSHDAGGTPALPFSVSAPLSLEKAESAVRTRPGW